MEEEGGKPVSSGIVGIACLNDKSQRQLWCGCIKEYAYFYGSKQRQKLIDQLVTNLMSLNSQLIINRIQKHYLKSRKFIIWFEK